MPKHKPIPIKEPEDENINLAEQRTDREREYFAVKANDLIQRQTYKIEKASTTPLSLLEQKILLYIISRIKRDTEDFLPVEIRIDDFYKVCGTEAKGNNYKHMKDAITNLASRVMWLLDDAGGERIVRWIDKAYITPNKGSVVVQLDKDLRPYLLMLHANYTRIPLFSIVRMNSKYGIQLYELLRSYANLSKRIRFNIEYLKEVLGCVSYENFTNFRRRVIESALSDINTYSELDVSVEYIRFQDGVHKGYEDIIFTIKDLEKEFTIEALEERTRRRSNVEREIDKNQISLFDEGNTE